MSLGKLKTSVSNSFTQSVIEPVGRFNNLGLVELWKYRQVVLFFLWRDLLVRYKQTVIGVVWIVLQPLCMALLFSFVFGRDEKLSSEGVPYPIFSYAGLLAWQYFAVGLNSASTALVANRGLVTRVYFPRIIIPLASILPGVIDFLVGMVLFLPILLYFHFPIQASILLLLLLVPLLVLTTLGPALWLSALVAFYRDFRIVVPFMLQFLMFASPVAYGARIIPPEYRFLYNLNPMVGIIEGFRWAFLGRGPCPWTQIGMSFVVALLVFASGLFYFRQAETKLADVV